MLITAAYHRVYDKVTCALTAKKPGSAPESNARNRVLDYFEHLLFTVNGKLIYLTFT